MIKWWTNFLCVLPISHVGYYTGKLITRAVYFLKNLQWHEFQDKKDRVGYFYENSQRLLSLLNNYMYGLTSATNKRFLTDQGIISSQVIL